MTLDSKYIDEILEKELCRVFSAKDPFLKNGAAGLVVFLVWLYLRTADEKYRTKAIEVMDKLNTFLSNNPSIEIYNGVIGIGLLTIWLQNQDIVNDDIDEILESIDSYVYRKSSNIVDAYFNEYDYTALDILFYLYLRLKTSKDHNLIRIFKRLWLKLFSTISSNVSLDFFIEKDPPELKSKLIMFLFICGKGSFIGSVVKNKIKMTLLELKNHCLSFFPRLPFNRLLLYCAVRMINETLCLGREWKDYEERLSASVLQTSLADQMHPNDMYLTHGIPCLIMFMKYAEMPIGKDLKKQMLIRIKGSELYNLDYSEMEVRGYVGLDGILGTIVALSELEAYD